MKITKLSPNGIEQLIKGDSAIVQIIERTFIDRQQMKFLQTTISDGFAKLQRCFFNQTHFPQTQQSLFCIVQIKLKINQKNKKKIFEKDKKTPVLVVDSAPFKIVSSNVKKIIGNPIEFRQYLKRDKQNHGGSNQIPDESDDSENQLSSALQQSKNILVKNHQQKIKQDVPKNMKQQKVKKRGPIQKFKKQQRRSSIRPQIKHHSSQFQNIKQLFLGMEDFKLLVRVLFVYPIKTITNKKGNQTDLLNIQFGDKSGTIMSTCFGDLACRYSSLTNDTVYVISGATLMENNYRNVNQLKLNLHDNTKLSQVENSDVPQIDYFCKSLKQLVQMPKGTICSVICLVKQGQLNQFTSKQGNQVKKKVLYLYDVENKIEAELVLFNDKAEQNFYSGVFAMKGIQVDQYRDVKQYKGSLVFIARNIKNHPLQRYLDNIQNTNFVNASSGQKNTKIQICSFTQLKQKCENIQTNQKIWSQILCYFKTIRYGQNSKLAYLSCPKCKKKVTETDQSRCMSCNQYYEKAMNRYILHINLIDNHEGIWVSAYDDIGQVIMAKQNEQIFTADQCVELNEQSLQQRLKYLRYKKLKVKMVSALEEYQGENRLKHKIVKLFPIDLSQENKILLQRLKIYLKGI